MKIQQYIIGDVTYEQFEDLRNILIEKYPYIYISSDYLNHKHEMRILFVREGHTQQYGKFIVEYVLNKFPVFEYVFIPDSNKRMEKRRLW